MTAVAPGPSPEARQPAMGRGGPAIPNRAFGTLFAAMGALLLGLIVVAIFNGIGARTAYFGRAFRYPIAIPFLRAPEFSSSIAAS